jgi:TolB-like protein
MQKFIDRNAEIGPQAVRAQVARILASEGFARSPRMQRFLEFVVEETLAGRAAHLGEYGVAVSVFDRPEDFEPALDPIVRNDARRLRLKLSEYYRTAAHPDDRVFIDLPKGGYVPTFEPIFKPSEGEKRSCDSIRRLAVLPFEVIVVAAEGWSLSRALCMSLTASLTGLDGVQTIAHGYVRGWSISDAAQQLKASHVIQGSILEFGDRFRVVVNLIEAGEGIQLWAREYQFNKDEALEAQLAVVETVSHAVTARLVTQKPRTLTLAAAA